MERGCTASNASGPAPRALSADTLRAAGHSTFPERGWASVSVPGAPDAWGMLHERFGRAPFESLFTAAIRYAEDGFPVSPVVSRLWRRAGPVFIGTGDPALDEWAEVFAPDGRTPAEGDIWRSAGHAATLRRIASKGPRDFYEGALAARIAECAKAAGGLLDGDDLAAFHRRMGGAGLHRVPGSRGVGDPAERAGDRGAASARDRGRHPHARSAARQRGKLALPDRGDEARVRRCVPLRGGSAGRGRAGRRHARRRLPRRAARADWNARAGAGAGPPARRRNGVSLRGGPRRQ